MGTITPSNNHCNHRRTWEPPPWLKLLVDVLRVAATVADLATG